MSARKLEMRFDGTVLDRSQFLSSIRERVIELTGECMKLDALIHEIVKNIFDHAYGKGSLVIEECDAGFTFVVRDDGQETYDFDACKGFSRLVGNGINFGKGLEMIPQIAAELGIDLIIDTTHGFSYSGFYRPEKRS